MLYRGGCLEQLKLLEQDSIDSLITDPPAGISFMGKDWDSGNNFIPAMTEVFKEAVRVMKPGAHGLVWALPRTSHWTATALENAGFEIRDVITHLFGSGFPKSLDISKAIDKAAGAEREVVGSKLGLPGYSMKPPKTERISIGHAGGLDNVIGECSITAPTTDDAKKWQGWGTALKPASEHWILIRKPCSEKTVAANVLKHGTGGINIDACRIGVSKNDSNQSSKGRPVENLNMAGRFPANLVLDEIAAAMLDEQSGVLKTGGLGTSGQKIEGVSTSFSGKRKPRTTAGDSGGASRFFYVAKASKKDRGEDNIHPTVKSTKLMEYLITLITPPNGIVLDPFMGSGSTGVAAKRLGFQFIGIEKNEEYFAIAEKRIG